MMIVAYDLIKHRLKRRSNCSRVLIYGTGDKSVALVMRLQNSPHYEVSGFLTYGPRLKNHMLAQHCVYYFESAGNVKYLRGRYDIDAILFATESEAQSEQERLLKYATDNDIKILIAPPIDEVVGGRLMKSSIREIKIEDLLGRPEIKISLDEIIGRLPRQDDYGNRCRRLDRLGVVPPVGDVRHQETRAVRQLRNADAQHPSRT